MNIQYTLLGLGLSDGKQNQKCNPTYKMAETAVFFMINYGKFWPIVNHISKKKCKILKSKVLVQQRRGRQLPSSIEERSHQFFAQISW
jgi:hypothetical protein